jgi:hypothetical protein
MTFPEFMLYYSLGTKEHLKLAGLYSDPDEPRATREISEESDHERLYNEYLNRQYDESSFMDLM